MQTLSSFLSSIALEQYHDTFLNAGATDQDLAQLVTFNDKELAEFMSALDMLPFHSIKFKKCLRQLNVDSSQDITAVPSTREFIVSHATIYGKKKDRALTSYEEAINNAALQLALENPVLISKKGGLFDLAKKQLLDNGYHYKRGSSRSKLKGDKNSPPATTATGPVDEKQQQLDILAKRQENAQRMSDKRIAKIELLQSQVEYALQSRQMIENELASSTCHATCDRLNMRTDLVRFEESKVQLTKEISRLKAQERKHQWYKRRKVERGSQSDEGFSSQASQDEEQQRHHSAFSICIPSSSLDSSQETDYLPSCSSSTSTVITCSRESDVRASSMSDYDR